MKKTLVMCISVALFLGLNTGCKKEEKATIGNQTVGQVINQTLNQTAEKVANQTQTVKQAVEKPVQKAVNQTQAIIEKTQEKVSIASSCLKCHGTFEKLSQSIKNSKATSGQELVKYLKTTSPHKNLHKNLKEEEIIKAFESVAKTSAPKKKIEGC